MPTRFALSELSEEQQDLVIECDVEETSLAELSRTSGMNENTLSSRLRRAHNLLRAILIGFSSGRLGAFVPVWLLRRLVPRDTETCEPWSLRIRRVLRQVVRQPMHFGANIAAAACVLGLAPGSPCAKDEPLDVVIVPEPVATIAVESVLLPADVFPGTNSSERTTTMQTATSVPKKNPAAPRQVFTSDDDDRLLIRAKSALKRQDTKSALEFLAEHERRFSNSTNAGRREALRAKALNMANGKR